MKQPHIFKRTKVCKYFTDVFEKDNSTLDDVQEQQVEETTTEVFSVDKKEQPVESQSEAPSRSELSSQDGQLLQRRDSNMSEMPETPLSMASTSNLNFFLLIYVSLTSRILLLICLFFFFINIFIGFLLLYFWQMSMNTAG